MIKSLEQECKEYFKARQILFEDHSDSTSKLDFSVLYSDMGWMHLEVKEKRQRYSMGNWSASPWAQPDLFILDDLTVRKCLLAAPASGVLVRDITRGVYVFFPLVALALMPRVRVNRKLRSGGLKGKWLISLQNGLGQKNELATAMEGVIHYMRLLGKDKGWGSTFGQSTASWGDFHGEDIGQGGITRQLGHLNFDWDSTR